MAAALFFGGTVKGAMGIGLPLIAVPVMAAMTDVPTAVATIQLPLVVANGYQALHLGWPAAILRRFWLLLVTLLAGLWWSTGMVAWSDPRVLFAVLGVLVLVFVAFQAKSVNPTATPRPERAWDAVVGALAGIIGGFSAIFAPPIVMYLVALGMTKEMFVQAVGTLFLAGSLSLVAFSWSHGVLNPGNVGLSAAAVVPVCAGLLLGQLIHRRIDPARFRPILLVLLVLVGLNLLRRAAM